MVSRRSRRAKCKEDERSALGACSSLSGFFPENRDHAGRIRVANVILRPSRNIAMRVCRCDGKLVGEQIGTMIAFRNAKCKQTSRFQILYCFAFQRFVAAHQDWKQSEKRHVKAVPVRGTEKGEAFEKAREPEQVELTSIVRIGARRKQFRIDPVRPLVINPVLVPILEPVFAFERRAAFLGEELEQFPHTRIGKIDLFASTRRWGIKSQRVKNAVRDDSRSDRSPGRSDVGLRNILSAPTSMRNFADSQTHDSAAPRDYKCNRIRGSRSRVARLGMRIKKPVRGVSCWHSRTIWLQFH
jgi:hypothetical protein